MLSEVKNEEEQAGEDSLDSDTGSLDNNESTLNQFTPPIVYLVRTNKVGELSEDDILPEDYQPIRRRLPLPLAVPPEVIPGDGEATAEMLLKISLTGIIRDCPAIATQNLVNYLMAFSFACKSLNREFIKRVKSDLSVFPV